MRSIGRNVLEIFGNKFYGTAIIQFRDDLRQNPTNDLVISFTVGFRLRSSTCNRHTSADTRLKKYVVAVIGLRKAKHRDICTCHRCSDTIRDRKEAKESKGRLLPCVLLMPFRTLFSFFWQFYIQKDFFAIIFWGSGSSIWIITTAFQLLIY